MEVQRWVEYLILGSCFTTCFDVMLACVLRMRVSMGINGTCEMLEAKP